MLTKRLLVISLSFSSLLIFCFSCYEPIEGCLDINSSNYEVSADRSCDSCCVFPNFNLNINQVFRGESFSASDTLVNVAGTEFRLSDYVIVLSGFKVSAGDQIYSIADSVVVDCAGQDVTNYEKNDLLAITRTSKLLTVGTWQSADSYNNIEFEIGLNDCYHSAGISDLSSDSRINLIDTLYESNVGFKTLLFEFNDSISYELIGASEAIQVSRSISSSNVAGSPLVMNMNIDFGTWLSDIDFNDDIQTAKTKLMTNATKAITFTE